MEAVHIDGSTGEGGGQILRTALSLSALTGQPLVLSRIRHGRPKPGLQKQHLAAVDAAAISCSANVEGNSLGSEGIAFTPGVPVGGEWVIDIGSAGSTTLVLQTILPILAHADRSSCVSLRGGTHNPLAPTIEFLQWSFAPPLAAMGMLIDITLNRHGFHPAGGGEMVASVHPWKDVKPFILEERGAVVDRSLVAKTAGIPGHIADREIMTFMKSMHWDPEEASHMQVEADGQGNVIQAVLRFANHTTVISSFGERRRTAEQVAQELSCGVSNYLMDVAPVCGNLADQLLLPLALGAGGRFRTQEPTSHSRTNADIIARFLGTVVRFTSLSDRDWLVEVAGRGGRGYQPQ